MKLSPQEAAKAAKLARLRPDENELAELAGHMDSILSYMETLGAVDTSNVEPLYSPVEHAAPMRDDQTVKNCERDEVLANAPQADGRFFIVPKIV